MKVLQINSVCGYGSTGKITTDIADLLINQGNQCKIAYGRGTVPQKYRDISIKIGTDLDNKIHGILTRFFDMHGFGSKRSTKKLLKQIDEFDPDIIHLHNIHGYYINVELLFSYLKKAGKPVVWTLHDCWAITGHCSYFSAANCEKWKNGCHACSEKASYPASILRDNSKNNYTRKKNAFTGIKNMTLVTPSKWLASIVKDSYLKEYPIIPIYNGINLDIFKPTPGDFRSRHNLENKKIILGVANVWEERKGLNDFVALSKMLDDSYKIILVGLNEQQIKELPDNIIKIARTSSATELAEIYSVADVYVNPSVEETMGLTTAEALACGTPVITYNKTAVPEVPDENCGIIVEPGVDNIISAIGKLNFTTEACLKRASHFEKHQQYLKYIDVYKNIKD